MAMHRDRARRSLCLCQMGRAGGRCRGEDPGEIVRAAARFASASREEWSRAS
ncbi:hypothetical protein GQ55_2G252100 [Panicum hallii var. hallii]|uniref:Uncharacterized protein n=1 Tax=Panicum hallii var. hallii TaxID=1504633 RepID=A0A2T7ES54_9POAL|nr:hypothetical protein GQ55_2G252100 [Panicum hallii var. hallii]